MQPLLLPIPATCKALGIGRSTVYRLIQEGALAVVKVGRRTLIRVASIRRIAGEDGADDGATT